MQHNPIPETGHFGYNTPVLANAVIPEGKSMRSVNQIMEAGGYLRKPDVLLLGGFKHSTLYAKIKAKEFPAPLRIFGRISVWRARDVKEWMQKIEQQGE